MSLQIYLSNMKLTKFFKCLFISGEWRIAIRKREDKDLYSESFTTILNTKEYWFADPLLFEDGEDTYLFVEAFNRKTYKGDIGLFKIDEGMIAGFELLIENNFHMSYPFVFKHDDKYYMIPESEENSTVDLYVADHFPYGWRKEKTLLSGVHYVDTTLLRICGRFFLFTYSLEGSKWTLLIFEMDIEKKEVSLFQSIEYASNVCRPAGKFFMDENGRCLRPVQNCINGYGEGILIYEIQFINEKFRERKVDEYINRKLIIDKKAGVDKCHTYTKSSKYEVIDYMHLNFDPFKIFKRQIRKYKRHKRTQQ